MWGVWVCWCVWLAVWVAGAAADEVQGLVKPLALQELTDLQAEGVTEGVTPGGGGTMNGTTEQRRITTRGDIIPRVW